MKPRTFWVAACTSLLWLLLAGSATAHGDLRSTRPEAGTTAPRVPSHIAIDFTEPPSGRPEIGIVDGCGRPASRGITYTEQGAVHVTVDKKAQPGTFKVNYRIVSAVDGHPSKGSYNFKVAGKRDCSVDDPTKGEAAGPNDGDSAPQAPKGESNGSTWLLIMGGGTVVLVGLALALRRSGGGGTAQ